MAGPAIPELRLPEDSVTRFDAIPEAIPDDISDAILDPEGDQNIPSAEVAENRRELPAIPNSTFQVQLAQIVLPKLDVGSFCRRAVQKGHETIQTLSATVLTMTHEPAWIQNHIHQIQSTSSTTTTNRLATDEPAADEPAADEPAADDPATDEPDDASEFIATDLAEGVLDTNRMDDQLQGTYSKPVAVPGAPNEGMDLKSGLSNQALPRSTSRRLPLENLRDRLAMRWTRRLIPHWNDVESADPPEEIRPALSGAILVRPEALIDVLETLTNDPQLETWARSTVQQLEMVSNTAVEDPAIAGMIQSIATSADVGHRLAERVTAAELHAKLLWAHHALLRRLAIYRAVLAIQTQKVPMEAETASRRHLAASLAEIEFLSRKSPNGSAWREYLQLDALKKAADSKTAWDDSERMELAREVASGLESKDLTPAQREFVNSQPMLRLRDAIEHWVVGSVDIPRLLKRIEGYESTGLHALGNAIATDIDRLHWSSDPGSRRLVEALRQHYRNGNLRLAISGNLMNRLLPQPYQVLEPVRDEVAGASVEGKSHTATQVSVRLVPDPQSLRVALEARGVVHSATASSSGPATFHSTGHTHYLARKLFILSQEGMTSPPAVANAIAENRLRAMDTRFDGIPIVNLFARSVVLKEHDRSHDQAISEIEMKVANKARHQLDLQSTERLAQMEERLRDKILGPIESLALDAQTVDLKTTADRVILRMLFAGEDQIGAHTPRPAAPGDSDLSLQLHESTINNALMQLNLEGREFKLPELYREIGARLNIEKVEIPEDAPLSARITFARHDAVRLRCDEGRIHLILAVAKLKHKKTVFLNFKVHAYYRPQLDRLHLQFVRDGVLDIEGAKLRPSDHIALQGIFVKVLTENRSYVVIPPERNADERLAGLMITQMVINDGWLGFALGPEHPDRVAWRSR
ncbi:MAG: hypothetical protein JW829_01265 [Pirellulales bacterium]|nr:hypothetical protein [Pirellulales bacterium]